MDPNVMLEQMMELVRLNRQLTDDEIRTLRSAAASLNDWLANGGDLPRAWTPRKIGGHYFTVIIPYSDTPTMWHPTEKDGPFSVLSRGAFSTVAEADAWAKANLDGQPYFVEVRR